MYTNNGQDYLAKMHQLELQQQAEQQRQAASLAPHRNVTRTAVSKLGLLLVRLGTWMNNIDKVEKKSPKPITGNLQARV
jgi:hypothetical protein